MVERRKFPYPYSAMLAIANDIDGSDIQKFEELHRFLNTESDTPIGTGVGLDISDSFWMYNLADYSINDETQYLGPDTISYWKGHSSDTVQDAAKIKRYINCGWIDSLHSYGDFSRVGGFNRDHAEKAIQELKEEDIEITTWINHGDSYNSQNFEGSNLSQSWGGDQRDTASYHTDITLEYGIKYIWIRRRGENNIGCDTVIEPVSLWDGQQVWGFKRYVADQGISAFIRYRLRNLVDILKRAGFMSIPIADRNTAKLWHPERLDEQLSVENLNEIVNNEQYLIVGQHLGCRDRLLPESARKSLKRLRKRQDDGKILVARTSRLLEYNRVSQFLEYDITTEGDRSNIEIERIRDPLLGEQTPSIEQVRGVTFYTDNPSKTDIYLAGDPIPESNIQRNPTDGESSSIGVQWFEPDKVDYTVPATER
ncbi:hypothetical protein [Halorubrum sp. N11]|uniref:hypothetical protein n=1 Tax=Halorubrum sp. N11 TaxID=3402276 RepID=UPI003EC0CCAC